MGIGDHLSTIIRRCHK